MVCVRFPLATAPTKLDISVVGRTKSSINVLTDFMIVAQPPVPVIGVALLLKRPSLPTVRLTLVIS